MVDIRHRVGEFPYRKMINIISDYITLEVNESILNNVVFVDGSHRIDVIIGIVTRRILGS